jgi:hypothetical protein
MGHDARAPDVVGDDATAAGIWPHLAHQPTVGATPNAVPHALGFGGKCIFSKVRFDVRFIFLEIFGSTIYFLKKNIYKNFSLLVVPRSRPPPTCVVLCSVLPQRGREKP